MTNSFWATCLCLVIAMAGPSASAADGSTQKVLSDDIVGDVEFSDEADEDLPPAQALRPKILSGGAVLIPHAAQQVAGPAIVRRTRRVANKPSGVNPLSVGLSVINVVNPMAWITFPVSMGQLPTETIQHEFAEQITVTEFVHYGPAPLNAGSDYFMRAQSGDVSVELPLTVLADGVAEIDAAALRRQLSLISGDAPEAIERVEVDVFEGIAGATPVLSLAVEANGSLTPR